MHQYQVELTNDEGVTFYVNTFTLADDDEAMKVARQLAEDNAPGVTARAYRMVGVIMPE